MAKALIVDDSKFMRRIIRSALEEAGFEVIAEADNGGDGVNAYKELKPDFVTMDITMGGKDGMKAAKEIHSFDNSARIIVISALNENSIRLNEPDMTATAFITKPFDKTELIEAINSLLS